MNALMKIAGSKADAAKRIAKSTAKGLASGLGLGAVGAGVGGASGASTIHRNILDSHDRVVRTAPRLLPGEESARSVVDHYRKGIDPEILAGDIGFGAASGVPAGGLAAAALGAGAGLAKGIHGEMKRRKKSQPSK